MLSETELAAIRARANDGYRHLGHMDASWVAELDVKALLAHIDALTEALAAEQQRSARLETARDIHRAACVTLQEERDQYRSEREYEIEQQEKLTEALSAERALADHLAEALDTFLDAYGHVTRAGEPMDEMSGEATRALARHRAARTERPSNA